MRYFCRFQGGKLPARNSLVCPNLGCVRPGPVFKSRQFPLFKPLLPLWKFYSLLLFWSFWRGLSWP
jgi:hypothetical protein